MPKIFAVTYEFPVWFYALMIVSMLTMLARGSTSLLLLRKSWKRWLIIFWHIFNIFYLIMIICKSSLQSLRSSFSHGNRRVFDFFGNTHREAHISHMWLHPPSDVTAVNLLEGRSSTVLRSHRTNLDTATRIFSSETEISRSKYKTKSLAGLK